MSLSFVRMAAAAGVVLCWGALAVRAADNAPLAPKAAAVSEAAGPAWVEFGPAALRRAASEDRLILLVLETPWNAACQQARQSVWNDPRVLAVIRKGFVPVNVRADLRPDLHARYPAEGWPGVSLLLPDGSSLYYTGSQATPRRMTAGLMPAEKMAELLEQSFEYYRSQRAAVIKLAHEQEAELEKAIKPKPGSDTDPSLAWSIAQQARTTFDPERRYFGGPPRAPRFELIELMLTLGAETDDPWGTMGRAALETLSSKLLDSDGGMRRMAIGLDWEQVQPEKLLERNARMLDLLTLEFRRSGRKSDRDQLLRVAKFISEKLGLADGSFAAALCESCPGGRDNTALTDANAMASAALIRAGAVTGETDLVGRGLSGVSFLRANRYVRNQGVAHAVIEGKGILLPLYLDDLAATAEAFFTAYQATGDTSWLRDGGEIALLAVNNLMDKSVGALRDTLPPAGAPAPLQRALFPLEGNSRMVRVLVLYRYLADSKEAAGYAARILRALSGSYERVPVLSPAYALAIHDFYSPPVFALITGGQTDPRAQALRYSAFDTEHPYVIVRPFDTGTPDGIAIAKQHKLPTGPLPRLTAQHGTLKSKSIEDPAGTRGLMADIRAEYVAAEQAKNKPAAKAPSDAPGAPDKK